MSNVEGYVLMTNFLLSGVSECESGVLIMYPGDFFAVDKCANIMGEENSNCNMLL